MPESFQSSTQCLRASRKGSGFTARSPLQLNYNPSANNVQEVFQKCPAVFADNGQCDFGNSKRLFLGHLACHHPGCNRHFVGRLGGYSSWRLKTSNSLPKKGAMDISPVILSTLAAQKFAPAVFWTLKGSPYQSKKSLIRKTTRSSSDSKQNSQHKSRLVSRPGGFCANKGVQIATRRCISHLLHFNHITD